MAEVKMDLAELKQLEDKIKTLEKEKQDLIDTQKQVVFLHKYFEGRIKPGKPRAGVHIQSVNLSGLRSNFCGTEYFAQDVNLDYALEQGLVEIELKENTSKMTKDYVNMSEVILEIQKEEEAKTEYAMRKALDRATKAEYEITEIEDKYKKKFLASCDSYNITIEKLENEKAKLIDEWKQELQTEREKAKEKYDKLQQEFSDFKEDKKRVSLEDQIKELQSKLLEATKPKSFINRLLNK